MFTCILSSSTKSAWREAREIYNNKSPSFGFDTCRHSVEFWKAGKSIFFFEWMKNSLSWEKTSSFERNTILRHFPGTLKVFFWLTYPFLFNNVTLFISRGGAQLACFAENRFISNAGLVFTVEICDPSVFAYNFYSIIVVLSFAQRNWNPKNCSQKIAKLRNDTAF